MTTRQRISEVINNPATSNWLSESLLTALRRDPVDAANDAEVLAEILANQVNELLPKVPYGWESTDLNLDREGRSYPVADFGKREH